MFEKTLVMDNASIHHANVVHQVVEGRGFQVLYLLAYSSFLNPIELFSLTLKAGVGRELLNKEDTLTLCIIKSAK